MVTNSDIKIEIQLNKAFYVYVIRYFVDPLPLLRYQTEVAKHV
jgi:hypothetical protein